MIPLLMIPGPIELSPRVLEAHRITPPGHLAPTLMSAFGRTLDRLPSVFCTEVGTAFVVAGSGTLAMEMAVQNLLDPGARALVVNTGYFSDRMAEMLRRRGVEVDAVSAPPGDAPPLDAVRHALQQHDYQALFATHVDTSTGVRVDAEGLCALARETDVMTVFDGVCATAAETFEQGTWGADVYLTASQKAIGAPPGLALQVVSQRALDRRRNLKTPPSMTIDWLEWLPIMEAYRAQQPAYFGTPPTGLLLALDASIEEILETNYRKQTGMGAVFERHQNVADGFRDLWRALDLSMVPERTELAANTLSAVKYPKNITGSEFLAATRERGVILAGGLHPTIKATYFRVGHMGYCTTQPDMLRQTADAIRQSLSLLGHAFDGAAVDRAVETLIEATR